MRPSALILYLLVVPGFLPLAAQTTQAIPDNLPNFLGPVGIPPHSSTTGTNEQISLATGALNITLPLLTLRQRGGWDLSLGYTYSSNVYKPLQNVSVQASTTNSSGQAGGAASHTATFSYTEFYQADHQFLEPNLPRLQASIEFEGLYRDLNDAANSQPYNANFCMTNFVFTDWAGSAHSFSVLPSCSDRQGTNGAPRFVTQADSLDGSFYYLDLSKKGEAVVTAKDGTTYDFHVNSDPWSSAPNTDGGGPSGSNLEDTLDTRAMVMTDANGNTVSVANRADQKSAPITAWVLTDTLGRNVSIGQDGISYLDANSTSSSSPTLITLSSTAGPSLAAPLTYGGMSCGNYNGNTGLTTITLSGQATAKSSSASVITTITMPVSDPSGRQRKYKLQFDADGHLVRIDYPTGGYTRYDFTNHTVNNYNANIMCGIDMFQVAAKHVCSGASGNCNQEDTTSYVPGAIFTPGGRASSAYNKSITEVDPAGTKTVHAFDTNGTDSAQSGATLYNPLERDTTVTDPTKGLQRSTHTVYQCTDATSDLCYPSSVLTTMNDSPSSSASKVIYKYADMYTVVGHAASGSVPLDNVTETDTYGFDGGLLTSVITPYDSASTFTAVPHILDKLASKTTTDNVTGQAVATTYGYDTRGNVTSVTTTANDIVTMKTTYGAYTNGYPASVTDGRNNTTNYSYTDSFAGGPCVPVSSGAYLTQVTQPDGSVTSYKYNACTGSVYSKTDTNGNVATYGYDSLGRQTSASEPGGFSTSTNFNDGLPNTVAVTTKTTPNPDLVTTTTLDGIGRAVSVVRGDMETDTAYDGVNRVAHVDEPKPAGSASVGTTVNTYDALDRTVKITRPDGSSMSTDFFGEFSVARDEVGSTRVITTNAQGLPISVCEVAPANQASGESPAACPTLQGEGSLQGYTTQYGYDGRGNLSSVTARQQSRSFAYDSLSRLTLAQNPEAGKVCYGVLNGSTCTGSYNANGLIGSKTDARGVATSFLYDSLNRVTSKTFSDGTPSACFAYASGSSATATNGKGRLAKEWTQAGACSTTATTITSRTIQTYDPSGHITKEQQCAFGACSAGNGTLQYTYDLAGGLTSSTNGAGTPGISLTYTADLSHRPLGITSTWTDTTHPPTLFSASPSVVGSATYGPYGLIAAKMGIQQTGSIPAVALTKQYDGRGRLISHVVNSANGQATAPSLTPIAITINANPVPSGVTAQASTTCDATCGAGQGYWSLDGSNIAGFTYSVSSPNYVFLNPNLPVGSQHQLQSFYQDANHNWYSSPVLTYKVGAALSDATASNMTITFTTNPVPMNQSGTFTVKLGCGSRCGGAWGQFTVDGTLAGSFIPDATGTAVNYTSNALGIGQHTLAANWYGNDQFSAESQSATFNVQNTSIPTGVISATVKPMSGNPAGDTTSIPTGTYGSISISNTCNGSCGTGQYFIDGSFAGGFTLDSSGKATAFLSPSVAAGSHKLKVTYAGSSSYGPSTADNIPFTVQNRTLPATSILAAPVTSPVAVQTWAPLHVTLSATGVTSCGAQGSIYVDGAWSDVFFVAADGTVLGNGRQYPLLRPVAAGSHTASVVYWGSTTCAPASKDFPFTVQ